MNASLFFPPHPQKIFCRRMSAKKVWGRGRNNSGIIGFTYVKCLIPEATISTGCPCFSTGCPCFSTGCPCFSTDAVFVSTPFTLSLLIEKEEERRRKAVKKGKTSIHGLEALPIFSSTGYTVAYTGFRGNSGDVMRIKNNELSYVEGASTNPRKEMPVVTLECLQ